MKRTTLFAVAALMVLGGCMSAEPMAGRADNDMTRFSSMNYTSVMERAQ
jgi:hypothetical protein